MSEKKIGFFGETPVLESELVDATIRDLFEKIRALGEDRDAWVERARQAEAEGDGRRAALKKYGAHTDDCDFPRYHGDDRCTCGLTDALKGAE